MALAAKKRKAEQNGGSFADVAVEADTPKLLPDDALRLLESLSKDQILDILQDATCRHVDVLDAVRALTDVDASIRKILVRGLHYDTTDDSLRAAFSAYGDIREAVVIVDKSTGNSKGYGFVTFCHVDGALLAAKKSRKMIDGRMTNTKLSRAIVPGASAVPLDDVSQRKLYIAGVPEDMSAERLLQHFSQYGEIEEGPIGYDKVTMKSNGNALFVYKTLEGANAAVVEKVKKIDGHNLNCSLAKGCGLPVTSSGFSTVAGYCAIPGSSDQVGELSSFSDVGAGSHHSLSSNLPSSLGVQSSRLMDSKFDLPPSPGRDAGFSGGYSSSSQFAGIRGGGGLGASGYDGHGYGGGAHYQLDSSGTTSGCDYGYPSLALRGQQQQPPRSPPDYRIPPRGSMYQ